MDPFEHLREMLLGQSTGLVNVNGDDWTTLVAANELVRQERSGQLSLCCILRKTMLK